MKSSSTQRLAQLWELPTCIHVFLSRVLEVAVKEMRFPEGE